MGLDMYLYRSPRLNFIEELNNLQSELYDLSDSFRSLENGEAQNVHLLLDRVQEKKIAIIQKYQVDSDISKDKVFVEVAYWRKFNALHSWFVRNCQNGIDECQTSEVTQKNLDVLLIVLNYALERKDASGFMPQSGFFFGSTSIDEYFWQDVESTIKTLNSIKNDFDFEKNILTYQSSW